MKGVIFETIMMHQKENGYLAEAFKYVMTDRKSIKKC